MGIYLIISLALLGSVANLQAQPSMYDLPIQEHIFENGLRLLVLEKPGDHRVACKIFTDFGALVETPGDLGSAHFLEHLMFKGDGLASGTLDHRGGRRHGTGVDFGNESRPKRTAAARRVSRLPACEVDARAR